jgi:hypothetical protein
MHVKKTVMTVMPVLPKYIGYSSVMKQSLTRMMIFPTGTRCPGL